MMRRRLFAMDASTPVRSKVISDSELGKQSIIGNKSF